jgi:hypothetical protein
MSSDTWWDTFDAVFFITISTLVCGCGGLVLKYMLKSKCENVNFCFGCLVVKRDIKAEVEEELRELELGVKDEEK